jgi:uncharacterized protein YbjT (DUF2867 family)
MRVGVVGAGVAARSVARALVQRGDQVVILSPSPCQLPVLWRRLNVATGAGFEGAFTGLDAMIYGAWPKSGKRGLDVTYHGASKAIDLARKAGVKRILILGPLGSSGVSSPPAFRGHSDLLCELTDECVVHLPVLFGSDDHITSSWFSAAEAGKRVSLPRHDGVLRPLWTTDAGAAVVKILDSDQRGLVELTGPEPVTLRELSECWALGRTIKQSIIPHRLSKLSLSLLSAQSDLGDSWLSGDDYADTGASRMSPKEWVAA